MKNVLELCEVGGAYVWCPRGIKRFKREREKRVLSIVSRGLYPREKLAWPWIVENVSSRSIEAARPIVSPTVTTARFLAYRGSHTDPAPSLSRRLPLPCPVIVRSVVCEQSCLPIFTRALKHGLVTHQSDLNVLKQACCVCIVPTPAAED